MTQLSGFWTTTGTPAGHQVASYTQAHWSTASKILAACHGFEGLAPGYLNQLAGTVTGANTVAINTGGALVDGKWFENDVSLNVTVPSAVGVGNTRKDRIVLRCSWAGFATTITLISGTDAASPTAPAITQTSGTTYDIPLYIATVNTTGTVTLTDERDFAGGVAAMRQGGHATNWATGGTTNYNPGNHLVQVGAALAGADGSVTVTLPIPYSSASYLVFLQNPSGMAISYPGILTASTFGIASNLAENSVICWMTIGPR